MDALAGQLDSVDVLIVGAGISGIGAAYYLQRDHPGRRYVILEARGASGGTWDLFRFPGVRSDSDLHTFGYEFRPWRSEVAIADGDSILAYLRETAAEYGIDEHVRYHTKVVAASWSSADARWTLLPEGYPVDEHFRPPYDPWDQRMCIVPDGDLFRVIRDGKASVVTGQIETLTEAGVLLKDGRELPADIIVTATGLNVHALGGVALSVDGEPVQAADRVVYKGMMLSGVPNFVYIFGYTNASWTLKVGLIGEHFTRLLRHMDAHGYGTVTPVADAGMPTGPFTTFASGYIQRAIAQLPRQGTRAPWRISPTYSADVRLLRRGRVDDPELRFDRTCRLRRR